MNNIDDYMRVAEAAKYLGVATCTLRRWSREGKIKTYRLPQNNWRLYLKKDLDKLLKKISDCFE